MGKSDYIKITSLQFYVGCKKIWGGDWWLYANIALHTHTAQVSFWNVSPCKIGFSLTELITFGVGKFVFV